MIRVRILTCLAILFILGVFFAGVSEAEEGKRHAVMVLVPGFSMDDFYMLMEKEDHLWINASAIALNRNTHGKTTPLNEVLTLSTGIPSVGLEEEDTIVTLQKETINEMERLYDLTSFQALKEKNLQTTHRAEIGRLGTMLKDSGVHTSFIGHSYTQEEVHQFAPFFTINQEGETAGNPEGIVREDSEAPGGYVMDRKKTVEWVNRIQKRYPSTWTVVEWGDFYRQRDVDHSEMNKSKLISELAKLLSTFSQSDQTVYLLGIAPPSSSVQNGQHMVPFAKWGPEEETGAKAWWSSTVEQRFLGSNLDAAPTLLQTFGIRPPEKWNGSPLTSSLDETVTAWEMEKETNGAAHIYKTRASVLSTYITLLVFILITGYVFWKKGKKNIGRAPFILKCVVLTGMVSPLSFLAASSIFGREMTNVPLYCATLVVFSVLIGTLMAWFGRKEAVWIVSFLLLLVLSLDILQGSFLMKKSYLGYDPLIGARYGGIGNELGGFFAAAAILFTEPLLRKVRYRWTIWMAALVFLIILGASSLGRNAGVTLASGLMFFTLVLGVQKNNWSRRQVIGLSIGIFIGLLGVLWILQQFGETSHIGRAFQLGLNGEWGELRSIAIRKLQMNIKIVMHSNWTKLLLTSYLLAALYLICEKNDTLAGSQKNVLRAGAFGSLFLLVLNDSGAVAASTSMFYLLCARFVWLFENPPYNSKKKRMPQGHFSSSFTFHD